MSTITLGRLSFFLTAACVLIIHTREVRGDVQPSQQSDSAAPANTSDEGERADDDSPAAQQVIPLRYADARETRQVVGSVAPHCRFGTDGRTNSLVVQGPASEIQAVLDVVKAIDIPSPPGGDEYGAEHFVLRHVPPNLDALLTAATSPHARIAIDDSTGVVVVRGTEYDRGEARRLIQNTLKTVTGPDRVVSKRLRVQFFFLSGSFTENDHSDAAFAPLPGLLDPVAAALKDHGIYHPQLVGSLLTLANLDDRFEVRGIVESMTADQFELSVEGETTEPTGSRSEIDLRVEAQLNALHTDSKGAQDYKTVFFIDTLISMTCDEYVVLAASPSPTVPMGAVVLVARVSRQ